VNHVAISGTTFFFLDRHSYVVATISREPDERYAKVIVIVCGNGPFLWNPIAEKGNLRLLVSQGRYVGN